MGPGSAAACADRREVRPRPVCRPGPLFLWEAATRQLPGPSSEGHPRSGGRGVARTRQMGPRAGRGAVVTWRVSSGARGDRQPPRAPFPHRRTELPRATKILLPASRIFIVRPRSPRDWPVQSETERTFLKVDVFRARLPSKKKEANYGDAGQRGRMPQPTSGPAEAARLPSTLAAQAHLREDLEQANVFEGGKVSAAPEERGDHQGRGTRGFPEEGKCPVP